MNNTLLELLLNATLGNIPPGQPISPPRWAGPNPAVRQAQAVLYATLCATLFAAFLATLGKQWLNQYSRTDTHGSIEDRCRERERKLSGIDRWWFHTVMQSAPLIIQGSLALMGSALSRYLWEVDRTVSSVVIGFTSFGCVLYITIVAVSVLFPGCPFQTPTSSLLRSMIDAAKFQWRARLEQRSPGNLEAAEGSLAPVRVLLRGQRQQVYQTLLSLSWEGYKHDASCIARMFVISSNMDTLRLTMDFVQEVVWSAGIKNVPLGQIYKKLTSCFDSTHPHTPILIPALRDVAYLSAKAFTHIRVLQRCFPEGGGPGHAGGEPLKGTQPAQPIFPESSGDPDLESVLLMVKRELYRDVKIRWDGYQLSPDHHLWVSHLFVYEANLEPLSDDVSNFVNYSLGLKESPGDAVFTDCLYIISIIVGKPFPAGYLGVRDKRLDRLLLFYNWC